MKQILHTYKLRLTNISRGNRSLKLAKLSPRRDVDWMEVGYSEGETPEAFLQKIIAGKPVRLIEKLDARFEKTNLLDAQLAKVYREIQTVFEETGTRDFFVGYPFVEGKFADGTPVRCPVLLFPVTLVRNLQGKPRWELQIPADAEILPNPAFFLAYEQYQQTRLKPEFWEEVPEYNADWQAFLNQLYAKMKEHELEVNFNSDLFLLKLEAFVPYTKETLAAFPVGKLTFKPQAVMGFFPQSDSALLQDYEEMEEMPAAFDIERFFQYSQQQIPEREEIIPEEERFFVTELDRSQEEVLLNVKRGKSLVVHGPPGTGKSQVIVNMIADAMMQGKKVLLVSQKRAALDVVYKRLSAAGLGRFAALVHDHQADRSALFLKIKQLMEDIPTFTQELNHHDTYNTRANFDTVSRQADKANRYFEDLFAALTHKQFYGLSVYDLYVKSDIQPENFPLEEVAGRLDGFSLHNLLEKLKTIGDYVEFYAQNYPWRHRISFHLFSHEDKTRISQKILALYDQIAQLNGIYQEISPVLGKDLLDTTLNTQRIQTYQQAQVFIQTPELQAAIAAIYKDNLSSEFLQQTFQKLTDLFAALATCRFIPSISWSSALELLQHMEVYAQKKNAASRLVSVPYQKAVWFIKKVMKGVNMEWTDVTYAQLEKEAEIFRKIWHTYTQTHEFAFFADFPAADVCEMGSKWLNIKQQQADAWTFIEGIKHFRPHKPKYEFGVLKAEEWQTSLRWIQKLEGFNELMIGLEEDAQLWLHPIQIATLKGEIPQGGKQRIDKLHQSFASDFEELKMLDTQIANLSDAEKQTLDVLTPFWEQLAENLAFPVDTPPSHSLSSAADLIEKVRQSVYFYWIQLTENQYPILTEVSVRGFARRQEEFSHMLAQKRGFMSALIQNEIKTRICDQHAAAGLRELAHQTGKKRKLWTMRKLVRELWNEGLSVLLPCWMASPESVSAVFPMQKHYFDLVIFDEASQCFVERAIPSMLRGKQVVIAGDAKQLQPFDMYTVKYEEMETEESDLALEVESVLDLAKSNLEEAKLLWHYRSQEEELMNFSNQVFYEGKLQIIPPAKHRSAFYPPLEWVKVDGLWENNANVVEAERVMALIMELIQHPEQPSLGIVTFNYFQQELIKNLIDKQLELLAGSNPDLYTRLQGAIQKTEKEEYMGLFVKNIENVQGDERDIIVFSVGYASNAQGKFVANFGLLNQQGGENRLNVAITRAKHKVYVISSIQPTDLQVNDAKYDGPRLLKNYLQYVKAISENRPEAALSILTANASTPPERLTNPIADYFYQKLTQQGYHVIRNFGDTRYKIDLAVKQSPDDNAFLLAIECEGPHYFSGLTAKEREVFRLNLLTERGWQYTRISARNFWQNREKELERVRGMLG